MSAILHASTTLLRSRKQFLRLIDHVSQLAQSRLLIFSLSHDTPEIEKAVGELSACTEESIGCLSGSLPMKRMHPFFSCSVAVLDRDYCRPFSTLGTGRGPIQVGRWHTYRGRDTVDTDHSLRHDEEVNWDDVWNRKSSGGILPHELKGTGDTQAFVYLSDSSSWDIACALHDLNPQAVQLGISASSTPFITGHPFTLLRNGKPQSSGAVGLTLNTPPLSDSLQFDGLVQLTRSLPVRRAEGNLIHKLGDFSPAQILLESIQNYGLPSDEMKDMDYYIGLRDVKEGKEIHPKLHRIVAGSPSKGAIAIEDVAASPEGSLLEFYLRPTSAPVHLPPNLSSSFKPTDNTALNAKGVLLGALVDKSSELGQFDIEGPMLAGTSAGEENQPLDMLDSAFLVSSEHGFVLSGLATQKILTPWRCTVPGTFVGLRY